MCDSLAKRAIWLKVWHFHQIQPKLRSDKQMTLCLSTRLEMTGMFMMCCDLVIFILCIGKFINFHKCVFAVHSTKHLSAMDETKMST